MDQRKKIIFPLEPDDDGYPPVGAERVWTREVAEGQFVIDNIPFFATQATLDDVVEAHENEGVLEYTATLRRSGNSLIRVIYYKGTDPADVRRQLEALGCTTELCGAFAIIAVNVPPNVKPDDVQTLLRHGFEEEKWDYEEPLLMQEEDHELR
jgi:hypothetical protein